MLRCHVWRDLDFDEAVGTAKTYHFRLNGHSETVFKPKDRPYSGVLLKAMGYALLHDRYGDLEVDPPLYRKHHADLVARDPFGEPVLWVYAGEPDWDELLFVLRHVSPKEVVILRLSDTSEPFMEKLRRHVHYRYRNPLSVVTFQPDVRYLVDLDHVYVSPDWYHWEPAGP